MNTEKMEVLNQFRNGAVVLKTTDNKNYELIYFNQAVTTMTGYSTEELLGMSKERLLPLVYEEDRSELQRKIKTMKGNGFYGDNFRIVKKNGDIVWVLGHCKKEMGEGETFVYLSFTYIDELITIQNKLLASESKLLDIVNTVPIGLVIFTMDGDTINVIAVNNGLVDFANYVGYVLDGKEHQWDQDKLKQAFSENIYAFCHEEDIPLVKAMLEDEEAKHTTNCVFRLKGSVKGHEIWISSLCSYREMEGEVRKYYVTFQNVTQEMQQKKELQQSHKKLYDLSYRDSLTGVQNRNRYDEFITYCKTNRQLNVGIVFADVNGLKSINDNLGHLHGDYRIKGFSDLLMEQFLPENIFRISGDEFVVVVPNIDREQFHHKMRVLIDKCFIHDDIASIGYIWKDRVSDIKRRANQAEQLMYVEKQKYYERKRSLTSKHRPEILKKLLYELEHGGYMMYLQPKASIDDGSVIGAEALVRRKDSNGNIIAPYEFIPFLEREKLIPFVDMFMLRQVCEFLEENGARLPEGFSISVNMSRVTMAENRFVEQILEICDQYTVDRKQIEFEVTESMESMDGMRLEEDIVRLSTLGFGVSIDDVGTEYSSFPMLTLEGIDTVKIDRSLVVKMKNPKVNRLITHLIAMCHDLDLKVVAEGVETEQDHFGLKEKRCDMFQGYLLSKPIPAEEFQEKYCIKE